MKLVVGLGNPGPKYQATRHNVGFVVLAELAKRWGNGKPKQQFEAETVQVSIDQVSALLVSPLTFMNRSGTSVVRAMEFYKLPHEELLVICDDFNLPLGKLRFRSSGSAGGQNGLKDIIRRLGTQDFSRLRIGVGQPPPRWDPADFVLSKFGKSELPEIEEAMVTAAAAVADWVRHGTEYCMNQYN